MNQRIFYRPSINIIAVEAKQYIVFCMLRKFWSFTTQSFKFILEEKVINDTFSKVKLIKLIKQNGCIDVLKVVEIKQTN